MISHSIFLQILMSRRSALKLSDGFAAPCCDFFRNLQLAETVNCCQNDILLVVGAKRLCTDILDACQLANCTCRAACDDTGTIGRLLKQNGSTAVLTDIIMRDTADFVKRNTDEVLGCIFSALADCFRNFSLTTLVTRLMATTLSVSSIWLVSIIVCFITHSPP